jgi:cytochrome c-type biogenesis protein CcmH
MSSTSATSVVPTALARILPFYDTVLFQNDMHVSYRITFIAHCARSLPRLALAAILLVAAALSGDGVSPAFAVEPSEMLADSVLEARARALSGEFRCLVCQNESIDESNADLAHDLRVLIRQQVKDGRSDAEIRGFLVARYGQFVLLKPRFDGKTMLLWLGPFIVLVAGLATIVAAARRRRAAPETTLSDEEREKLERLGSEGAGSL